ncbi:MAG: hypothetical protein IPM69_17300 [Ignavibacteria bacterium]|nr:hypothetical protein [Ignavibacteria bacterium]
MLLSTSHCSTGEARQLDRLNARYSKSDEHKLELLNELTKVYGFMQLDSMSLYVEKSIDLARRLSNKKGLGDALNNKGYLQFMIDKNKESKQTIIQAIEINKSCNNFKGLAWSYLGIATVYKSNGDFETYKSYTLKALEVFTKIKDVHGISNSYLWLGTYYLNGNDSSKVKANHQKALAVLEALVMKIIMHLLYSFWLIRLDDPCYDSALAYRLESL